MYCIVLKFIYICLIGYEINNPPNKTEIILKDNTNLILTDGSLLETSNTLSGNITLIKISMKGIYCVRY